MSQIVTLEEVLAARDQRVQRQQQLISQFGQPVISFTLNIPGETKDFPLARQGFETGLKDLLHRLEVHRLPLLSQEHSHNKTGSLGFLVVEGDPLTLKAITTQLEDSHPLGRLFDMDLIAPDQKKLSREDLGLPPRRCLLCEEEAFVCARSRAHSLEQLAAQVQKILLENPGL